MMVKEFDTGPHNSYLHYPTNIGGTLFFGANDGTHGLELWKSDGTEAGTVMVKDINPGPDDGYSGSLTNVGGTLFFVANGRELWKSDGTEAGTAAIKKIRYGMIANITHVGGTLVFTIDDELWMSDGYRHWHCSGSQHLYSCSCSITINSIACG